MAGLTARCVHRQHCAAGGAVLTATRRGRCGASVGRGQGLQGGVHGSRWVNWAACLPQASARCVLCPLGGTLLAMKGAAVCEQAAVHASITCSMRPIHTLWCETETPLLWHNDGSIGATKLWWAFACCISDRA